MTKDSLCEERSCISLHYQEQQYILHYEYYPLINKYYSYGTIPHYIKNGVPRGYAQVRVESDNEHVAYDAYCYYVKYLKQIERYV